MATGNENRENYVFTDPESADLPRQVFEAELRAIRRRRSAFLLPVEQLDGATTPDVNLGLVGISLSGGGIRSSTFNLGVLQALDQASLLHQVDYLSTVSGGGYIGSCLSSYFAGSSGAVDGSSEEDRAAGENRCSVTAPPEFPFRHISGALESRPFRHLRECASYLKPPTPFAGLRLPGLFLRGLLVNAVIILPTLLLLSVLTVLIAGPEIREALNTAHFEYLIEKDQFGSGSDEGPRPEGYRDIVINLRSRLSWVDHDGDIDILLHGLPQRAAVTYFRHGEEHEVELRDVGAGFLLIKEWDPNELDFVVYTPEVAGGKLSVTAWESDNHFALLDFDWSYQLRALVPKLFDAWHTTISLKEKSYSLSAPPGEEQRCRYNIDFTNHIGRRKFILLAGVPENSFSTEGASMGDGRWLFGGAEVADLQIALNVPDLQRDCTVRVKAWQSVCVADLQSGPDDVQVYDPVSRLYRGVFRYTKWVSLTFLLLLGFYPILKKGLQPFGLEEWRLRDMMTRYICGAGMAFVLCFAFLEMQPLFIFLLHRFKEAVSFSTIMVGADKALAVVGSVVAAAGGLFAANTISRGAGIAAKISLYCMGVIGPAVLWIFYLNFCLWALANENVPALFRDEEGSVLFWYLLAALTTYCLSRQFYNVNRTSLHPFYRDRLSETFLIAEDHKTGALYHNDEQKLHLLNTDRTPYHIINATLNIVGRGTTNLKGRKADFFSFSRDYVGSRATGYAGTQVYEKEDMHMGLGTAMAISGAAAAPNMGRVTTRSLTFIMALLNIRLGYWAQNPTVFDPGRKKSLWARFCNAFCSNKVGPFFLLKEMVGLVNEKSAYVNLSDGGHLENMGLYELVRRRCKYIIVCDAEADKGMSCGGFSDAVRMILIDMGIKIHINLDGLYRKKRNSDGSVTIRGERHHAIGTIEYGTGKGEQGYLLYIKSSVSGVHAPYILDYLAKHGDFPHESTADQFFNEAQFEAYRALGCEVGDETIQRIKEFPEEPPESAEMQKDRKQRWAEEADVKWAEMVRNAGTVRKG